MGGYRAFAEPRPHTIRFDKRNGNKNCNSESDFNVARQVFRSWRTKNLRIPNLWFRRDAFRVFLPLFDSSLLIHKTHKNRQKSTVRTAFLPVFFIFTLLCY